MTGNVKIEDRSCDREGAPVTKTESEGQTDDGGCAERREIGGSGTPEVL